MNIHSVKPEPAAPTEETPAMANLGLSDDEKMVQDVMGKFAREQLRPVATEADAQESPPEEVLRKGHAELALALMAIPEALGGAWDGTPQDVQRVVRTHVLAYGCAGLTLALPGLGLAAPALVGIASQEQAARLLEPFCGDEPAWASLALVEPLGGAELEMIETRAEPGAQGWTLSGRKGPVPSVDRARGFVVVARADDGPRVFWVSADAAGVKAEEGQFVGLRAAGMGTLSLDGAPAELLGEDDSKAQAQAAQLVLDHARLSVAALACGVAKAALDEAVEYSKTRVQFGEPIGQKQGIAFMEAEMAMDVEGARLLLWRAAALAEAGKPFGGAAAGAHAHACRSAMRVAMDAVQIHGGYGFIRDYPVEKWMRDAKALGLLAGAFSDSYEEVAAGL